MSNLSRLRHRSSRSARQAARSIRYTSNGAERVVKAPKKEKSLLELTLVDNDNIIVMDINDIIPDYSNRCGDGTVHNEEFYAIRIKCEKVGLVYAARRKWFMLVALNDYECSVLFESKKLEDLPNISPELLKHHKVKKANRLMNSCYDIITDYTSNPYHIYKTSELFSK